MTAFEPRPFGKYYLTDRIAVGGMAEIYKAKTFGVDGFEKTLAIKKILPNYSADKDFIQMITDEAKLVVSLSHPNIVQVYDLGRVIDDYFISMEYIDGMNLRELINRASEMGEKVPLDVAIFVITEMCKGLDYAHSKTGSDGNNLGIVHRDVSPHNVLVSFESEVKLVDFGIAKAAQNTSQTQLGTLKGKVAYMSPEQALGKPIDHQTDIFSAGLVFFELLTGKRFFNGESQIEVLEKIRKSQITEKSLKGKVPDLVVPILAKALTNDKKSRYQDAADMQIELTRILYANFPDFTPRKLSKLLKHLFPMPGSDTDASVSLQSVSSQQKQGPLDVSLIDVKQTGTKTALRTLAEDEKTQETNLDEFLVENENTEKEALINSQKTVFWRKNKARLSKLFMGFISLSLLMILWTTRGSWWPEIKTIWYGARGEITLKVITDPPGASIILDGDELSQVTPYDIPDLEIGETYLIDLVRDGYQPERLRLKNITADQEPVSVTLVPLPEDEGYTLTITSDPKGALIFVNGKNTEFTTPHDIKSLQFDDIYNITLKADGFQDYMQEFVNNGDKDTVLDVKLLKIPTGSVLVDSDPKGANILLNGQPTGQVTPHTFTNLTFPQKLFFQVQQSGYALSSRLVEVENQDPKTEFFELKSVINYHEVKFDVGMKGAEVFVDGKSLGVTPLTVKLSEGDHIIKITKEGYEDVARDVEVRGEQNFSYKMKAIPKPEPRKQPVKTRSAPPARTTAPVTPPVKTEPKNEVKQTGSNVAALGSLRVDSSPRGGQVLLNGTVKGITPIVVSDLPKNKSVNIQVKKKGYQTWQRSVNISRDNVEVNAKLVK
jgi:serine/threonine protein kinase